MTIGNAVGWGVIFLGLIAATDIPPLASIAAITAWLILVAVLLKYGPPAFTNVSTITAPPAATTGGGTVKKQ